MRTISSSTAKAFNDLLPGLFLVNEDSLIITANPSLAEMNQLADSIEFTLQKTLDAVAPLKRKKILHKKLAPWYNDHTRALKQALWKLERKWRSTTYRHISNLPFLSKILEKAVTKQLCSFLESNSTLEVFQSGFSTETALLKVLNEIQILISEAPIF